MKISQFNEGLFDKYLSGVEQPYGDFIEESEDKLKSASQEALDFDTEHDSPQPVVPEILNNKYKHPGSLNYALRRQFGKAWIDWEPETIDKTASEILDVSLTDFDKNMIGCLSALFKSSKFFTDYRVFGWSVYALNQQIPRMDILPRPHPGMLLDTYASTTKIRPGIYKDEVKRYVNEEIREYGVKPIPGLLMGDNDADEVSSNIKSYLNAEDEKKAEKVLNYLQEEDKQYILKTIGMIDYYMTRLNVAVKQLNRLQD